MSRDDHDRHAATRDEDPAARLRRFVQPLVEDAGDDPNKLERALALGTVFWNLALCEGDRLDDTLDRLVELMVPDGQDAASFRALARDMVARHRALFPDMHP